MSTRKVVIIGNGVAGVTAARHIRKMSDDEITIISAESDHFYSRTALMYIYMGHMTYEHTKPYEDWFWKKNRIGLVRGYVERIDTEARLLRMSGREDIPFDVLIIATGSRTNMFGWPGQELAGVQGLYSLQDLEQMEGNTKGIGRAVIVGGGLIGVEVAEMLCSRRIPVTFLVREQNYWDNILPREEAMMIGRHIREHGVDLRLGTELREILPDSSGRVRAVMTSGGEEIACGFVALTAGVAPNVEMVKDSAVETGRGVLVNEFFETNLPDVYAIGDCAEFREPKPDHPAVEQLWYTARMHGEVVAHTICGRRTVYDRGVWFNSAKFFDIEYQTYGMVRPAPRDDEDSVYWEHRNGRMCVRLVFDRADRTMRGVNLFGVRGRHRLFENWIRERRTVDYVLRNFDAARFDPEFAPRFEQQIGAAMARSEV